MSHRVRESPKLPRVTLEISWVCPIITESVRVGRIRVYDNGYTQTDRQTNTVTFVLFEVANLQLPHKS